MSSCADSAAEKQYRQIKNSGLAGEPLVTALSEFELQHMNHFSSKVDLGGYFFLTGNVDRASDYFRRAETLIPKNPRNAETRDTIAILYASLGRIALMQSEYNKALDYAEKAIAIPTENSVSYRLLKGHVLVAQEKLEEALALFEAEYDTQKDTMSAEDLRAFMYLLANAGRAPDCALIVDRYFERGSYFNGLGMFASTAYEAAGQENKAILAAFLDYEYHTGYTKTDDREFLANLDRLEKQLVLQARLPKTEYTLQLVRSLYNSAPLQDDRNHSEFFVEDYIILKKKILASSLTAAEFDKYLKLEHYFSRFPGYYWNVWQATAGFSLALRANYIPVLQKIITLDKDGRYAQSAWEEMTKLMGYSNQ
ncbi:hypothetical protein AGMMS50293_29740 [Spirochaetia bacterium]|nr:hypothetical protein AGMMS50293_29740 [Spirochaetia bacterium]